MNPTTPLEIFLPPVDNANLTGVNLLMASNWDGLNSGAFALRVNPWCVSLLSAVLAYPIYHADWLVTDRFRDQSAFQWLLAGSDSPLVATPTRGREHWAEIPMRWFNSIPFNNAFAVDGDWIFNHNMTADLFDSGTKKVYNDGLGGFVQPWKVMQGDMVVHFAGSSGVRDSWMAPWLDRAEKQLPVWNNSTKKVSFQKEAGRFWKRVGDQMGRLKLARA